MQKIEFKKVIFILTIALICSSVLGQKFIRDYSFVERTPTANNTIEDAINGENLRHTSYDWINYVHFVVDDRLYLLSYEPVDDINQMDLNRQIYLYSKDISDNTNPWEPASEAVLTCGFMDLNNYTDVDFYREDRSRGSVGKINAVGDVREIIISEYRKQNGSIVSDKKLKIVFTPISTNFYSIEKCYL